LQYRAAEDDRAGMSVSRSPSFTSIVFMNLTADRRVGDSRPRCAAAGIDDQVRSGVADVAAAVASSVVSRLAIRQVHFPFDLCLCGRDFMHLRHRPGGVLGVGVDAKPRPLPLDPALRILVLAGLRRCVARLLQRGRYSRRFGADEELIGTVADARDPNRRVNAICTALSALLESCFGGRSGICCEPSDDLQASCASLLFTIAPPDERAKSVASSRWRGLQPPSSLRSSGS
jgi:hypothetical protein